jgi:superkiller protein 3
MATKAALKAVRNALAAKDFQDAAEKAKNIIEHDPNNYHAYDIPLMKKGMNGEKHKHD